MVRTSPKVRAMASSIVRRQHAIYSPLENCAREARSQQDRCTAGVARGNETSVKEQGLTHWADPARTKAGEINRHDGGRASTFRIRAATCWKSSLDPTEAAAGNHKKLPPVGLPIGSAPL
jgi:hypothetical protein